MKIIVTIKQVPNIASLKFDTEKKTLVREGIPLEVSSYDLRALIKAVDLVKEHGGEVVAMTMGPPQAEQALRQCFALGADRGIHLCDPAFAGSDTLATARALSAAIWKEECDLVFAGRCSVDAETGQVGPQIAEVLDLPQVTGARTIEIKEGIATLERETDDGFETVRAPLPLLVTAAEDFSEERFPRKKDREAAKEKTIKTLTPSDLGSDPSQFGPTGSPTWVKDIVVREQKRRCQYLPVEKLVPKLLDKGLFSAWEEDATIVQSSRKRLEGEFLVVAELADGEVRSVTGELIQEASRFTDNVSVLLVGHDTGKHHLYFSARGVKKIYVADTASLEQYGTERYSEILKRVIQETAPTAVLLPSTSQGRDWAPRVAGRLQLGLTGDCVGLDLDEEGQLLQYKPAFGGNVVAPIVSNTMPQMATVRPGILAPAPLRKAQAAEVLEVSLENLPDERVERVSFRKEDEGEAARIETADIVVGFGMGVGDPEKLQIVRDFASMLDAPLVTTRDCTDAGWISKLHQVGLTGRSIAPKLYFAIGIQGAFEHTVGIQRSSTIVAINKDPQAWMWETADYGLEGDWEEILPKLSEALQAAKG